MIHRQQRWREGADVVTILTIRVGLDMARTPPYRRTAIAINMATRTSRRRRHVCVVRPTRPGQTVFRSHVADRAVRRTRNVGRDVAGVHPRDGDPILHGPRVTARAGLQRRQICVLHRRLRRKGHPDVVTVLTVRIRLDMTLATPQRRDRIAINVTTRRGTPTRDPRVIKGRTRPTGGAMTITTVAGGRMRAASRSCQRPSRDGETIQRKIGTSRRGVAGDTRHQNRNLSVIDMPGRRCARP